MRAIAQLWAGERDGQFMIMSRYCQRAEHPLHFFDSRRAEALFGALWRSRNLSRKKRSLACKAMAAALWISMRGGG